MYTSKKIILTAETIILVGLLNACGPQFVDIKENSKDVRVANETDVSQCILKGKNTVRITGYAERISEYIERDLLQLSKNAAVEIGGNTIVMTENPEKGNGTQSASFKVFYCNYINN